MMDQWGSKHVGIYVDLNIIVIMMKYVSLLHSNNLTTNVAGELRQVPEAPAFRAGG
jgi:hypothetical protein